MGFQRLDEFGEEGMDVLLDGLIGRGSLVEVKDRFDIVSALF